MKVDHKRRQTVSSRGDDHHPAAPAHDPRTPRRASRRGRTVDEPPRQIWQGARSMEHMLSQLADIPKERQSDWFTGDMLARELHAMADVPAACKALALRIDLSALSAQPMEADFGVLIRLLTSLVINAIRHTPDGGQIALTGQLVRQADGARAVFTVENHGVRIEPAAVGRMGQPLARDSGLAIVRQLAERMHGEIDICSTPGAGTTYTARVPVIAARRGREEAGAGQAKLEGETPCIPAEKPI